MLRSMTGFGRCLLENDIGVQQWEIRSVNGRQLDFKWRLPQIARPLELNLEKLARRHARRGRVEINLDLRFHPSHSPKIAFDSGVAAAMLDSLKELAISRGEYQAPDYAALLHVGSLWSEPQLAQEDGLADFLEAGLTLALEDWNESRAAEGKALALDIQARIIHMEEWTGLLASLAPEIRGAKLAALRERLARALDGIELDDDRFLQEMVILTDRIDATEELTRLATHLDRLRDLLEQGNDIGRRLDFTLQECLREINTCGNKLQDAQVSRLVVDFKNELEKCREQAMNLE